MSKSTLTALAAKDPVPVTQRLRDLIIEHSEIGLHTLDDLMNELTNVEYQLNSTITEPSEWGTMPAELIEQTKAERAAQ